MNTDLEPRRKRVIELCENWADTVEYYWFERPETMDHNQKEFWHTMKNFVFGDGRVARIGGDSRIRYSYCQEYLLPSLLYAADWLRDGDALTLAEKQIDLIEKEAEDGDGFFYGSESLKIDRAAAPRGGKYQNIRVEEICLTTESQAKRRGFSEVIADCGFAVISNAGRDQTDAFKGEPLTLDQKAVRGIIVTGLMVRNTP